MKNGDYAFVQHMVSSMKPGSGRVGVVMPYGVLFRGGAEAKIRRGLIEKDVLEAVVGLPPKLFYSTDIPACLLIFRDQKPVERKDHVLFIDGSARFIKGKKQNLMSEDDVRAVIEAYQAGCDSASEGGANVRLVPLDEIEQNGFDLSIGRYIKVAAEETADLGTALVAYADARQHRIDTETVMFERLAAAGVDLSVFGVSSE